MARRKKRRYKNKNKANEIAGVLLIALGALSILAVYLQLSSVFGESIQAVIFGLTGAAGYAMPVLLIAIGILVISARHTSANPGKLLLIFLVFFFVLSMLHVGASQAIGTDRHFADFAQESYQTGAEQLSGGGLLGSLLAYPCMAYLGFAGSYIVLAAAIILCVIALTNLSIKKMGQGIGHAVKNGYNNYRSWADEKRSSQEELYVEDLSRSEQGESEEENPYDYRVEAAPEECTLKKPPTEARHIRPGHVFDEACPDIEIKQNGSRQIGFQNEAEGGEDGETARPLNPVSENTGMEMAGTASQAQPYVKPSLSLLAPPKPPAGKKPVDIRRNAEMLEATLSSFGIVAKVVSVSRGPVVTRYELQPAPGVKVSRIVNLSDDIALNFAVAGVRIEAPIPGKAAVGIEVPNEEVFFVPIRELLASDRFKNAKSPVTFPLGKDIAGEYVYGDIAKMPHLLIAGATGSGKSVCVNSLIVSLLYKSTPQEVRMVMIDPKVVELNIFNNIPHLLAPVVTDPKKAASSIQWVVNEMTMRYRMFALQGAKDLQGYNVLAEQDGKEPLPHILVIIDELADLMMVSAKEVEDAVCRIAQLGRACGIHLVIATQRPSVDVITGLIKANIPSRIAFAVSSQVDSRTILDMAGAEKLLGQGDMLYYPSGAPKPIRLQGCFITDREVDAVTTYIKKKAPAVYDEKAVEGMSKESANPIAGEEETDDLLQRAVEIVVEYDQASISMLQRRLRVGYARAARLIDEMEVRGIVSGFEGSKPRQVLITKHDLNKLFANTQGEP